MSRMDILFVSRYSLAVSNNTALYKDLTLPSYADGYVIPERPSPKNVTVAEGHNSLW